MPGIRFPSIERLQQSKKMREICWTRLWVREQNKRYQRKLITYSIFHTKNTKAQGEICFIVRMEVFSYSSEQTTGAHLPILPISASHMHAPTLPYLINVCGRLLFSENISRVDALIRWWTLINFLAKFEGGRLFQCGRLLILAKCKMQCNVSTCIF